MSTDWLVLETRNCWLVVLLTYSSSQNSAPLLQTSWQSEVPTMFGAIHLSLYVLEFDSFTDLSLASPPYTRYLHHEGRQVAVICMHSVYMVFYCEFRNWQANACMLWVVLGWNVDLVQSTWRHSVMSDQWHSICTPRISLYSINLALSTITFYTH